MSKKLPRVEFPVTPEERKMLDSEAEIMNCTRQELIRDRLFTKRVGRQTIDLAIETVTRRYQGIQWYAILLVGDQPRQHQWIGTTLASAFLSILKQHRPN